MSKLVEKHEMIEKIVFVGDAGVGKTSLLRREAENCFTSEFCCTIGVDFKIKRYQVGQIQVKAQIWDTAGQERFRSIQKPYYRGNTEITQVPMPFFSVLVWPRDSLSTTYSTGSMRLINTTSKVKFTWWAARVTLTRLSPQMRS